MITKKERLQAYKNQPENIRDVYGSEKMNQVFDEIIAEYQTDTEFKSIVGDAILGFYQTADVPAHLQEQLSISADDAQRIYTQLVPFLEPVIEQEKNKANPKRVELKELESYITKPPSSDTSSKVVERNKETEAIPMTSEPAQPSPVPTPVQGMRTMEADMSRVHGYGAYRAQFPDESREAEHTEEVIRSASQEDILKEKPTLTDMPTYQEGDKDV